MTEQEKAVQMYRHFQAYLLDPLMVICFSLMVVLFLIDRRCTLALLFVLLVIPPYVRIMRRLSQWVRTHKTS